LQSGFSERGASTETLQWAAVQAKVQAAAQPSDLENCSLGHPR